MKYFSSLGKIAYNLNDNTVDRQTVTNILKRSTFLKEILENTAIAYDYEIKDGDTPEIIAHKLYGDVNRHWIVLLYNNILNPYYEFPLTQDELNTYIQNKYGYDMYTAMQTIHHYEQQTVQNTYNNYNILLSSKMESVTVNQYITNPDTGNTAPRYVMPTINNPIPPTDVVYYPSTPPTPDPSVWVYQDMFLTNSLEEAIRGMSGVAYATNNPPYWGRYVGLNWYNSNTIYLSDSYDIDPANWEVVDFQAAHTSPTWETLPLGGFTYDGASWIAADKNNATSGIPVISPEAINLIAYGNGKFVTVRENSYYPTADYFDFANWITTPTVHVSSDGGTTWNASFAEIPSAGGDNIWYNDLVFANGWFILSGYRNATSFIKRSTDGITWETTFNTNTTALGFYGFGKIVYQKNTDWYAFPCWNGMVYRSQDNGATWTNTGVNYLTNGSLVGAEIFYDIATDGNMWLFLTGQSNGNFGIHQSFLLESNVGTWELLTNGNVSILSNIRYKDGMWLVNGYQYSMYAYSDFSSASKVGEWSTFLDYPTYYDSYTALSMVYNPDMKYFYMISVGTNGSSTALHSLKNNYVGDSVYSETIPAPTSYTLNVSNTVVTSNVTLNAISVYDYEYAINEGKRTIKLLDASYVAQIEEEFKGLMRDG